ncbi:T-cell-interacting, activating receptor on myeloid cells protein 1-like [Alligator sinensis]|uniref:T-cell-interacting, activating receptor on myeloid cells protein 1-like n=1 Tax=Alligator sinensis TaxID=38654 RepID=UPI0003C273C4|nr:T-cell-interacting, activating receptor on myeloid cells protein 1-like [Alligator sinensis]
MSALTSLFLGFWLAREGGVLRQSPLLKVLISVRPSRVITLGGNATIQCDCQCPGKSIQLLKNDIPFRELQLLRNKNQFNFSNADRQDGGNYSCQYWPNNKGTFVGSEHLKILVADPKYPKPSLNLSPSKKLTLGENVTIQCLGGPQDVEFFLYKDGNMTLLQPMAPARNMAELFIRSVRQADGGRYQCFYQKKSEPFVCSYHSYPMQLVVIDYTLDNIIHLGLGAGGLLLLVFIAVEAMYDWQRGEF